MIDQGRTISVPVRVTLPYIGNWQAQLLLDPSQVLAACDQETHDRYHLAVVALASEFGKSPGCIVQSALSLANKAAGRSPQDHVGYYLVDDGVEELKRKLGVPSRERTVPGTAPRYRLLLLNTALAAAVSTQTTWLYGVGQLGFPLAALVFVALFLVSYDYATNLAHRIIGGRLAGRWLPTLDFVRPGLPDECRTAIAVPCLLVSKAQVDAVLDAQSWNLRVANDENVRVTLLTDFCDSASGEDSDSEGELLRYAVERVEAINQREWPSGLQPFLLLHRDREFSATQSMWIGRERKRGKIEALNRKMCGETSEFRVLCGDGDWLLGTRFVLCLDEDSRLSRDSVQLLVGALAHPLNAAVIDSSSRTIVRGHALLVPILRTRARSSGQWRLSSIITGPRLEETRPVVAMRDFHFDYYRATHFPGKGLYEVAAYRKACEGRIPPERVLSHDTLEGAWLNPGFCGRAQVVEGFPSNQRQLEARQLRWVIGDWQNLFFILVQRLRLGPSALPPLLRSIVFNQTRISLTPVALTFLLALAVIPSSPHPFRSAAAVGLVLLVPLYVRLFHSLLIEPRTWLRTASGNFHALAVGHVSAACRMLRAPLDAALTLRSIATAAWRSITKRNLLEWRAASLMEAFGSESSSIPTTSYLLSGIAICALALLLLGDNPSWTAILIASAWACLPAFLAWTARHPSPDLTKVAGPQPKQAR